MAERLDNFALNVREQLKERGWTAPDLARKAGVSTKTINNILNGRHAPQLDVLAKIAQGLDLELWQMWLPKLPKDARHDETFPRLVTRAAQLNPDAMGRIAHIVDLELRAASK